MIKRSFLFFCTIFLIISCANEVEVNNDLRFIMVQPESSGIDFSNDLNSTRDLNILTYLYFYNGAGVAAADFNNDGLIDLYFCSNQSPDKLYINKGNFKFRDISEEAGLSQISGWSTGVSVVDINNDGLLDIYVCEVGNYKQLQGHNRLYVNKGLSKDSIPVFKEESKKYNLDFKGLSTQSAFFDYDLDGDLDIFLMNHSVHPNSNYGIGELRNKPDSLSGDRLFQNVNGRFKDVSQKSGIFSSKIGYGLGLAIGDLNNDGYPDIYVGNDFFENDYAYINQRDGTFKDIISAEKSGIGHTSHYSMGVDISDFNNDGLQDIISLDMLPEDLTTYKASGTEYSYQIYNNYLNKGYANQYMQNALQLNRGGSNFSEIGYISGVSATEWSWAPLFADLDNDGFKDLFISNGILGATNDMDYISFIANEKIQKRINKGITDQDMKIIDEIPEKKTMNYFFKNSGGLQFENMNSQWLDGKTSFSNGAVYADLDNDGDLDLVTNNVNEKAFLYRNRSREKEGLNFLKFQLKGSPNNLLGIGARVKVHSSSGTQVMENYLTRGFLSSVPPELHFGMGKNEDADSIEIFWPDGSYQKLKNVKSNQKLSVDYNSAEKTELLVNNLPSNENIEFNITQNHKEYSFKDFLFEPLIPYAQSNLGPSISTIDYNMDGLDDLFISGDRFEPGKIWIQNKEGKFVSHNEDVLNSDGKEPVDHVFFDANADGSLDLLMVYGGSDPNNKNGNQPSLYIRKNGRLIKSEGLPSINVNASACRTADFNSDGYIDILITSNAGFGEYGPSQNAILLLNDGDAKFHINKDFNKELEQIGLVYDAEIVDVNADNKPDIVIAGHYMPITILLNQPEGKFEKFEIRDTEGWWNDIEIRDYNKDGKMDIIAGNWGLNSRLKASVKYPMQLYLQDFDDNGKTDPILTYYYKGRETPLATKDELTKQIPVLNKSYLSYNEFAKADFNDYFSEEKVKNATRKKVVTLETTYFENKGNLNFEKVNLPVEVQFSPVHAIHSTDFDSDGLTDIIMAGNNYHINTQLGRQDAGYGIMLRNTGNSQFEVFSGKDFYIKGAVKAINEIKIQDQKYLVFGINNESVQFVKYPQKND